MKRRGREGEDKEKGGWGAEGGGRGRGGGTLLQYGNAVWPL